MDIVLDRIRKPKLRLGARVSDVMEEEYKANIDKAIKLEHKAAELKAQHAAAVATEAAEAVTEEAAN